MKRLLVFDGGDESKRICVALLMSLRFGRSLTQTAPGKAVLRQERDIKRAFAVVTEPDPEKANDLLCQKCAHKVMERDPVARRLLSGGGTVELIDADVELLTERIDKGPWTGDVSEDMADALDFLVRAPEAKA